MITPVTLELGEFYVPVLVPSHAVGYSVSNVEDAAGAAVPNKYVVKLYYYIQSDFDKKSSCAEVYYTMLRAELAKLEADPQAKVEVILPVVTEPVTQTIITARADLPKTREAAFTFQMDARGYWEAFDAKLNSIELLATLASK